MNNKDKKRIERLQEIKIPKPQTGGSKTATTEGFIGYGYDMMVYQDAVQHFYFCWMIEENIRNKFSDEEIEEMWGEPFEDAFYNYQNPDDILAKIEAWYKKRGEEGWETTQNLYMEKII